MSLIIASFVLSASLQGAGETPRPAPARLIAAAAAPGLADAAGANAAKDWLALVDGQRWAQSWTAAGTLFRTHISQAGWASNVQSVRQPLGPVTSRVLQNIARSASLPGAPDGEYEVVQFATDFSNKHDAVETVALARESSGWKVIGYYIK